VRRSRRRFWKSGQDADARTAFLTLWDCLVGVSQLTAPFTPFVADEIWRNLTGPVEGAPDSVHLSDWPEPNDERADDDLRRRMGLVRKLVTVGRAARTEAGIRVRQPLSRALIVIPSRDAADLEGLEGLVADELNVKAIELARGVGELVSYTVKPNFRALGPRFGRRVEEIRAALAHADPQRVVADIESSGRSSIEVNGETVELTTDDLDVRVEGRSGFSLAQDGPYGVALDVEITPELRGEGLAREVVRAIQDLRKSSGLEVEDRIELWMTSPDRDAAAALEAHRDYIAAEVLATSVAVGEATGEAASDTIEIEGASVRIALRKAAAR
jgi:isoleucyl-tRNA synthetase